MLVLSEPVSTDEQAFVTAMQSSIKIHKPWVKPPLNRAEFHAYLQHYQAVNQKSYLLCDEMRNIMGVFNLNEIIRGSFQNAFLGFYAVAEYAGKGYMKQGLNLLIEKAFGELNLHRLEANIQPDNLRSIGLVRQCGFLKEGFSPKYLFIESKWRDHERWAITSECWKA